MPESRMATVTVGSPSLPAAHAALAWIAVMFHCQEARIADAGLVTLCALIAALDTSAFTGATGDCSETRSFSSTSAMSEPAESDDAPAEVRPLTTATPDP